MHGGTGRRPFQGIRRGEAERVVAVAVRAPSLHNSQPWLFTLEDGALELRTDGSRHLPGTDPARRQLVISCGAALFGARLGMRSLGLRPQVDVLPEPSRPDLLARLRVRGTAPTDAEEIALLRSIPWRWSVRSAFAPAPVPTGLLTVMRRAAARERAVLLVLDDPARRRAAAELVAAADRAQRASAETAREVVEWTSRRSAQGDGIPPWAYPPQLRPADPERFVVRDFAQRPSGGTPPHAPTAAEAPTGTPLAAALLTSADRPADWLRAGQALYRVLLTAAAGGVQASLHSQPFGVESLRRAVQEVLTGGAQPQLLLQFGHPTGPDAVGPATPRRPVADVLSLDGAPEARAPGAAARSEEGMEVGTFDLRGREARP